MVATAEIPKEKVVAMAEIRAEVHFVDPYFPMEKLHVFSVF